MVKNIILSSRNDFGDFDRNPHIKKENEKDNLPSLMAEPCM